MERRNFIKSACITCGAALTLALLENCAGNEDPKPAGSSNNPGTNPPSGTFTLDLNSSQNNALKNVGGYVYQNRVIIINTASGYVALSAACTHNGCTVSYASSANRLNCPCHGGAFDINGNVVAGPPPTPLKKYTVSVNENILTITS